MINEQPDWVSILWGSDYFKNIPILLREATESVLVCMFHVALPDESHPTYELIKALLDAHQANVNIKILLDNDRTTDPYRSTIINLPVKELLEQEGISCRFDQEDTLLHSKFIIIDTEIIVIGSHNWTAGSYFIFDDLSIVFKSKTLSQELTQRFEKLWDEAIH